MGLTDKSFTEKRKSYSLQDQLILSAPASNSCLRMTDRGSKFPKCWTFHHHFQDLYFYCSHKCPTEHTQCNTSATNQTESVSMRQAMLLQCVGSACQFGALFQNINNETHIHFLFCKIGAGHKNSYLYMYF